MKRHLGWIPAAATAIFVGAQAPQSVAQYPAYQPTTQPPSMQTVAPQRPAIQATQPAYTPYRPQTSQYAAPAATQSSAPAYPQVATAYPQTTTAYPQPTTAYPQTATYPQTSAAYPQTATNTQPSAGYPQTSAAYPQSYSAYPQTATTAYPQTASVYSQSTNQYPQYPGYPSVAQQTSEVMPPQEPADPLPPPSPGVDSMPSNGQSAGGYGYPANDSAGVTTNHLGSTSGCVNSGGDGDYGVSSYFTGSGCDTQWFGGVYWLYMNRDDGEFRHLTSQFDTPGGGYPYYPTSEATVLSTDNVDHDFRSGFEVRFGSTLGGGASCEDDCNACGHGYGYGGGCDSGCGASMYAWEVGYWFLDDDLNTAQVVDAIPNDTYRMYGMKNFAGIEYNGRPVNDYYDYEMPVTDPADPAATDVRLLAQRVRSNFQAQSLELNLLRLPVCGLSSGGRGGYGCDDYSGCAPACDSAFSLVTLCGVRYVRIDDDFQYASMWAIDDGTGTLTPPAYTPWDGSGELYYDVNVDNHLTGFQLGANMNYCVACKWNLFWNTNFGLYNNHVKSTQRVFGEFGPATWVGSGEDATVSCSKNDVAFVGEMLLGGSYDFTCNWRGVLAYRAVAISGVALSTDQIPEDFSNRAQVGLIDSNGSLVIHGVQVGAECRY